MKKNLDTVGGANSFISRLQKEFLLKNIDSAILDALTVANRRSNLSRLVVRVDGLYNYKYLGLLFKRKNKQILENCRSAKFVIFQSVVALNFYRRIFNELPPKYSVISNGIPIGSFKPRKGNLGFVTVSNTSVNHKPLQMIYLARALRNKYPSSKFLYFSGAKFNAEKFLFPSFLLKMINFIFGSPAKIISGKTFDEIRTILGDERYVGLYMSSFAGDSCPNSVIELMGLSIPIVISNGGGASELVPDNLKVEVGGTLYKPSPFFWSGFSCNVNKLFLSKIENVVENYEFFQKSIYSHVSSNFDIKKVAINYRKAIEHVLFKL
jgi:glycosyltransferase involved in cell wall biosynthesis